MDISDITVAALMRHVKTLAEQFPHRFTGEAEERLAARYVASTMKEYGLEVQTIEVPIMGWEVESPPTLEITAPVSRPIECAAFIFSGSTPTAGLEGELAHVGTTMSWGHNEKLAIVDPKTGAWRGYVLGRPDGEAIAQVGPPSGSAGLQDNLPYIWPCCMIGQNDLAQIQAWLAEGQRVSVRYHCRSLFKPDCTSFIVCGELKGRADPNSVVVMGSHHDCQGANGFPDTLNSTGANDNASGGAIFLELARHYAQRGSPKTLWFLSFGGEERGLLMSREFVRILADKGDLRRVVAGVFIDQGARGDLLRLYCSDGETKVVPKLNMTEIVNQVADHLKVKERFNVLGPARPHSASDHWPFYYSGVPLFFTGWHPFRGYHRSGDNVDALVEDDKFLTTLHLVAGVVEKILALDVKAPVDRGEGACYVMGTDL